MRKKIAIISAMICLILSLAMVLVACDIGKDTGSDSNSPDLVGNDSGFIYEEIIANNIQSAVCIRAGTSSGSGVLISANGYIVTNYHVVEKSSGKVTVDILDSNGVKKSYSATMIPKKDTKIDLAVIKINERDMVGVEFKGLKFATSSSVNYGTPCVMMGNPKGLGLLATRAMISNPDITVVSDGQNVRYMAVDTPVNPGNSGGALVDRNGKIIGIVTARHSGKNNSSDEIVLDIGYAQRADDVVTYLKRYAELSFLFV